MNVVYIVIFLVVIALIGPATIVLRNYSSARRARNVIANGIKAQAKIVQVLGSRSFPNMPDMYFSLLLEITPRTAAAFQEKRTMRAPAQNASAIQPGSFIDVYIDTNDQKYFAIPGTDDKIRQVHLH